ncbi:variable surface protein [Plasmodium gonderi]|uniref:Variable surface protein n=1 Tax=Plasmodium gonderi TaxID=77519 RepID=A0A1Y1JNA5_PLAGO|nr:variable surface protein [Plasmodium gonderi]GAW83969.1 variable surface protein [Plasmodium gonderi]
MEKSIVCFNYYKITYSLIMFYAILENFPKCLDIIEKKPKNVSTEDKNQYSPWEIECTNEVNITKLRNVHVDNRTPQGICIQVMEYLGEINNDEEQALKDAGCEFFYYWIYYVLFNNNEKKINDIQSQYEELINIYNNAYFKKNIKSRCIGSKRPIEHDDFKKILELSSIYNSIYKNTKRDKNDDIFKEVIKIVKLYNSKLENNPSKIIEIVKEPSCKNSSGVTIIITFVVTIIVFLSLFILYKFTIFGSLWRNIINRKISKSYSINEERNVFQGSEIYSVLPSRNEHNLLYFSP